MTILSAEPLRGPALILAADHRPRAVMTIEAYRPYLAALSAALPACDGILASRQPLEDLVRSGAVRADQRTYLSINRTGLAGSAFELDDRLVTTVSAAVTEGWTGIKHMTRIDLGDPLTAPALELLGRVIDDARAAGLEALIESLSWRDGRMARDTEAIVRAAVIAHDLGVPLLKIPSPPSAPAGSGSTPWPGWWRRSVSPSSSSAAPGVTAVASRSSTRWPTPWPAGRPGWLSVGSSSRIPIPPPWPRWWPTWCTAVDPHLRPRDLDHQSRSLGR